MKNSIVKASNNLPANIEDIAKFVLIGREKLISVKAEIRAMGSLKVAEEVYKQKEVEAKELGGALLLAKVRIGELLQKIPPASGGDRKSNKIKSDSGVTFETKQEKAEELGFSKKDTSRFQQLADNKDIVEKVIENSEDIPTQTECLKKIQDKKKADKKAERQESTKNVKPITGKYEIIYTDPPWKYDFAESSNREIENHYPTMELEDMKNIEVPCEDNSVLLMWATAPKLLEALDLAKAWGFEYKTQMIWDKQVIGMGYWCRGQHEILLIATKGKFSPPETENRVSSIYSEKRGKHSKKPDYYYNLIEKMFPNCSYLELFSRKKYNDKWQVWGNEV